MLDEVTLSTQRHRRRIAMTAEEIDSFLGAERTCRLASLTRSGAPHVSALWFAWDGASMWFYSIVNSERWADIERDPRAAVIVDGGHDFGELVGVELRGSLVQVGEVPRLGETPVAELEVPERMFPAKYFGSPDGGMFHDKRHAWLRLTPEKIASWDHRKIGAR
jgi:hypothetical protein